MEVAEGTRASALEWRRRRVRALRLALVAVGLGLIPFLLEGLMLAHAAHKGIFAIDFNQTFLPAARKLAAGHSPYPEYGYPPLMAFLGVPLTWLPSPDVVFTVVLALCVPLAMWLLDVHDWRCYGVVFLWATVYHGLQTANVSILLLLSAAAAWRYREAPWRAGVAGGLGVALKFISWPLVVWYAATGRFKAAVRVCVVAAAVTFGLWATIGFSGLLEYPRNTNQLQQQMSPGSYTVKAVAIDAGLPATVGTILAVALALGVLVLCIVYGRRGDDRRSFSFAVLACVVASPIVWLHSFVFLLAPLSLARPRFSPLWLLPVVLVLGSGTGNGAPWQTALVLGVSGLLFVASVFGKPSGGLVAPRSAGSGQGATVQGASV
jgi:hypothetical protein